MRWYLMIIAGGLLTGSGVGLLMAGNPAGAGMLMGGLMLSLSALVAIVEDSREQS
jgi:hypothetical protein